MTNSSVNMDSMHDMLDRNPCGLVEHEAVMIRKQVSCEAHYRFPA